MLTLRNIESWGSTWRSHKEPQNWIPLYKMVFFLRRNSTKSEKGEKNACLGPKNCPAAGGLWINANFWRHMSLIQKLDYFDTILLKKPQGKILEGNINIGGWRVGPGGSCMAQKLCRLNALRRNLITFCHLSSSFGGQSGTSVRSPPLLADGQLGGKCTPTWTAHLPGNSVGLLSGVWGHWQRSIAVSCYGSRWEVCSGTCCGRRDVSFLFAEKAGAVSRKTSAIHFNFWKCNFDWPTFSLFGWRL